MLSSRPPEKREFDVDAMSLVKSDTVTSGVVVARGTFKRVLCCGRQLYVGDLHSSHRSESTESTAVLAATLHFIFSFLVCSLF
jgi:hypothetical protein